MREWEKPELENPYSTQPLTPSATPNPLSQIKKASSQVFGFLPTLNAPETILISGPSSTSSTSKSF